MIAALILEVLGVRRDAIFEDFLLSNAALRTRLRTMDEETIERLASENQ
ncbi:tyrosine-protein phosphatase [bacterium]|nr:tyrosine-protein phosphatase [bacterium]